MKTIFFPKEASRRNIKNLKRKRTRITVQLRNYDECGSYSDDSGRANETIHFKGISLKKAYKILREALLESEDLNRFIEIE